MLPAPHDLIADVAIVLDSNLQFVSRPTPAAHHYKKDELPVRERGRVVVRSLLPHTLPNLVLERMEFPEGARLVGTPHSPGTREYLTCEAGALELSASGQTFRLAAGDVVVFRGDQKHGYVNTGKGVAVGYSVVVLRPVPE